MKKSKQFFYKTGVLLAATSLLSLSAFAESRRQNGTESHERTRVERAPSAPRAERAPSTPRAEREPSSPRVERAPSTTRDDHARSDRWNGSGDENRAGVDRRGDRETARPDTNRSNRGDRDYDRDGSGRGDRANRSDRNESWRGDHNRSNNDRWSNNGSHNGSHGSYHGRPSYYSGRISRSYRYGSGWRLWIVGAPYPFFVPDLYYRNHHLRVGLSIGLGGYYNPLGYYDYYDGYDRYYDRYDRYDSRVSRGTIRGTVESVDYRRDTFVIRNDETGDYITVIARDRDRVREGDYVEISGDWNRSGVFQAYDIDRLDDRYEAER